MDLQTPMPWHGLDPVAHLRSPCSFLEGCVSQIRARLSKIHGAELLDEILLLHFGQGSTMFFLMSLVII